MKKTIVTCLILSIVLTGCGLKNNSNTSTSSIQSTEETSTSQVKNKYIIAGKIDTENQVNITSKISGKISEMSVDIGSDVNTGDTIVKLDTQELQAQVDQAKAAVNTANANLNNAMNSTRDEQVAKAQAALDSANEACEVAQKNYDRIKALVDAGASTEQQLEASHQQLTTAQSQQKSAQEELNMLNNGPTESTIDVYKAQVEQAKAALKTAEVSLSNGVITSPISGVVTAKNINVGEMASPGSTILTISNPNTLVVNAYAPLSIANQLEEGQEVVVKVSEVENQEFDGKILVINSKLSSQSTNVLVKVSLSDPNSQLKPGMFAEIGLKE